LGREDYASARDDLDEVIRRRPELTSPLVNRSLALERLGEPARAVEDLNLALEKGAEQTRIYFMRATLKTRLGDAAGAAADRQEGLRRTPSDELSWIARGVARLADEPEQALADFQQSLALNPRSIPAQQNIAHVLAERLGRIDEALEALNQLLLLDQENAQTLASRGVLFARSGKRAEALADAQAALAASDAPLVVYQAGCTYSLTSTREKQDADMAVQLISRALKKDTSLVAIAVRDPDLLPLQHHPHLQPVLDAAYLLSQAAD
jgi:tetratricopeptide (TPR) repeat protein